MKSGIFHINFVFRGSIHAGYFMLCYTLALNDMVWNDMVWYGMVWCGVVWYGILDIILYSVYL